MKINKVYHKPNTLIKTVDNQRIGLYSNGGLDYVFQGFETTVDKNYVNSKDKVLLESQAQLKSAYKQNLKNSFLRNSENENSITDFTKDHRRELNSNPSLIARSFRLLNIPFHKNKHMFITRADSSMITDTNGVKLYPLSTVGSNPWLDNSSFTELLTTDFEPREVEKIDDKATFMYLHLNNLGVKMRDAIVLHNTAHSDEAIPYVGTSTATALGSLYPAIYAKTIYRAWLDSLSDYRKSVVAAYAKTGVLTDSSVILNKQQRTSLGDRIRNIEENFKYIPVDKAVYKIVRDLLTPKKLFDMDIFELANAIVVPAVYGLKNSTIKEMYFVELANGVGGKIFTIPGGYLPLFTKDIIPQKPLENSTNNIFSVNANMFDHFTKYHYLTRCKDLFDVLKTIDLLEFDDMKTFDYQFPKDFDLQDCNNQTILATMPNESDNLTASVGLMGEVYPLREISLIKNAPSQSDFKILYNYAPYSVIIPSSKLSSTTLHTDTGNYKLTSGTNQTFLIDTFWVVDPTFRQLVKKTDNINNTILYTLLLLSGQSKVFNGSSLPGMIQASRLHEFFLENFIYGVSGRPVDSKLYDTILQISESNTKTQTTDEKSDLANQGAEPKDSV